MLPDKDYFRKENLVRRVLQETGTGNLLWNIECSQQYTGEDAPIGDPLPDHIGFYLGKHKVGSLFYTTDTLEAHIHDERFAPACEKIVEKIEATGEYTSIKIT